MRPQIIRDLSSEIDPTIANDLVEAYEELVSAHRSGNLEVALTKAGRFVENTLRAIEYIRTAVVLIEIKSVQGTIRQIENDTALPDSLRLLIPRVVFGMMYDLRSKRDAVHVNEIDPRHIDAFLCVSAASWVVGELLRLYHSSDEAAVAHCMLALSRTSIPYIESIDGETFVGQNVPAVIEILLLLANASPEGMTRRAIGLAAKCSQPSVTNALKAHLADRHVHRAASDNYFITSGGEQRLAAWLAEPARSGAARTTPGRGGASARTSPSPPRR